MLIDFDLLSIIIGVTILFFLCIFLKVKKKKDNIYLLFFCIFFMYLLYVAKYTIFPIPISGGYADIMRKEASFMSGINIIPFKSYSLHYLVSRQVLYNILLSIPFGFGISYLVNINKKKLAISATLFGVVIESIQLIISMLLGFTYRSIDINDIIFNFLGVIAGYFLFIVYSFFFIKFINKSNTESNSLFKYMYNISIGALNL